MKLTVIIMMLTLGVLTHAAENVPTLNFNFQSPNTFSWKSTETSLEIGKKDITKMPNRRKDRPFGLNLYAIGPGGIANVSADIFITPKLALEGGAGFRNKEGDFGYFLGGRYHIFGNSFLNLTPYVGVYTAFHQREGEESLESLQNHSMYVPFGLHRIKKSGINWAIEIAYEKNTFKESHDNLSFGFKLGYRF